MDRIFQLSSALFAISANYLISTALVQHPKQFSALVEGKRKAAAVFKESSSAQAMKEYILATYDQGDELPTVFISKAASKDVSKAFEDSSLPSSDEEKQEVVVKKPLHHQRRESSNQTNLQQAKLHFTHRPQKRQRKIKR